VRHGRAIQQKIGKSREVNMEPRIVARSAFTVVGMKYHGRAENQETPRLWGALEPRIGEIDNIVNEHTSYGISANMDMESSEFDYIAGFEVSSAENVPEGMVRFEVPSARYAVFATTLSEIGEAFDPEDPDSEFDLYLAIQ
jgi:predicted transcriptional regulator YdeE